MVDVDVPSEWAEDEMGATMSQKSICPYMAFSPFKSSETTHDLILAVFKTQNPYTGSPFERIV